MLPSSEHPVPSGVSSGIRPFILTWTTQIEPEHIQIWAVDCSSKIRTVNCRDERPDWMLDTVAKHPSWQHLPIHLSPIKFLIPHRYNVRHFLSYVCWSIRLMIHISRPCNRWTYTFWIFDAIASCATNEPHEITLPDSPPNWASYRLVIGNRTR